MRPMRSLLVLAALAACGDDGVSLPDAAVDAAPDASACVRLPDRDAECAATYPALDGLAYEACTDPSLSCFIADELYCCEVR